MKRLVDTAITPIEALSRDVPGTGAVEPVETGRRIATIAAVAALAYYLGSLLGLGLQAVPTGVSSLWPSNAFLLGVLLIVRRRHWWLVLAAIVPAHLLAHGPAGIPASIMTIQLACNIAQATLSAVMFQWLTGERPRLEKLKTMSLFIGTAAIVVPALVALVAAGAFEAIGWRYDLLTTWRVRFQSNALAVLTITPLVILAWQNGTTPLTTRTTRRALEAAAIAAGIAAAGYWIAVAPGTRAEESLPLLYLPVPMLLLATIRFGLAGACLSVLVLGTVMVWGALHGDGTVVPLSPFDKALAFGLFLIATAIPLLLLAALLEERNRAQQNRQELREELARLNRIATMGEFAASITHELLQPLSAILTNAETAEMLLEAEPPALADVRELLVDIRSDNQHAVEIIRRTRRLLQKHGIVRKSVDMNNVVSEIISLLNVEAGTRGIQVRFEPDPQLPAVSGDRVHLQQVMTNLALNAFEAMTDVPESARTLTVRSARNGNGMASVTVSDTGTGIDEHILPKLFEPFCTTKTDGLGMGLSISRTIVEAHQGSIWGKNNPGTGATFGFTLPLHDSRAP